LSRRELVTAGALGGLGLGLTDLFRAEAAHAAPKREMSCILLWLRGGPSSIDMWDLKPEAPPEIRGEFKPIKTTVSGIEISEHLPRLARVADKYCLVRSVTHPRDDHEGGSHVNATGWNSWPAQKHPMYGVVVQKLLGYRGALPPHIHLPEIAQEYSGGEHFLPRQDLPFTVASMNDLDLKVKDLDLVGGLDQDRFGRRRRLLQSAGSGSPTLLAAGESARSSDVFQARAFDMLTGSAARAAFDLTREPSKTRERYGRGMLAKEVVAQGTAGDVAPNEFNRSIVGQGLLMARRLVEAGVRFVTVVGRGWDTHADNFNRLKSQLLPFVDQGVSALLEDLAARGMLDTTLVVVTGDFNRTPRINKDAGRDHWGHVQTVFLAGGGIPGGVVVGASDEQCAYPKDRPIRPEEIAATIYHRLGISPGAQVVTPDGRPHPILPDQAEPVAELV
jgi:hypothetical protein